MSGCCSTFRGALARGNWTAALYVDERASIYAVKALTRIFTGKAGGSTGLLKILVGSFLGVRTEKIIYEIKDGTHIFQIPKIIEGVVKPIAGKDKGENVVISNTAYWVGKRRDDRPRRDLARARLRPQLEFRRPLGRDCAARLGQLMRDAARRNRDAARERAAFAVHIFTASRRGAGAARAAGRDRARTGR